MVASLAGKSPAGKLPATFAAWAGAIARVFRENGAGFVLWTLGVGSGIGVLALSLFGASGPVPRHLPLENRPFSFLALLTIAVAVLSLGAALVRRRRDSRGLSALYAENIRCAAPLSLLSLVAAFREPLEQSHPGAVLAIAALAGIVTTYSAYAIATEAEPGAGKVPRWAATGALVLVMVLYALYASHLAIRNHQNLNTGRSDLGYYLSIFRQTSQGHLLGCSLCGGGSHLTGHFDPILVLLSPLFLLYPYAETLLVLQTIWLASGAIAVYLLALRHVRHRGAAVALGIAYLLYPALHGVNFFDFHSVALCIPLFVWLLYFLEGGARVGYYFTLALLLLVREDISIALVFVGLYALFSPSGDFPGSSNVKSRVRMGWVTMVLAVTYFVVVKAAFMGRVDPLNTASGKGGGYAYFYEAMIPAGYSTAALVGTLLSNPAFVLAQVFKEEKVDFLLKLLVPLFGLPLVARGRMMLAYGSALTLLASRQYLYSIHFQYTSLLIPFLFVLTVSALGRVASGEAKIGRLSGMRLGRALSFGVLVTTLLCTWKFGALIPNASFQGGFRPLNRDYSPERVPSIAWLKKIGLALPRGARVAANSRLVTHLGPVSSIDLLENRTKADYVVLNVNTKPFGRILLEEEAAGDLKLIESFENLRLYKTNYKSRGKPAHAAETPEQ
jgi:uncharacterized membrane protein